MEEGIDDLVTFEGTTVDELIKAFHGEVDDYIRLCKEQKKESLKSYKGNFHSRSRDGYVISLNFLNVGIWWALVDSNH